MDCWHPDNPVDAEVLEIPHTIQSAMIGSLDKVLPEEGCGLLAGTKRRVSSLRPITNVLHDPAHFLMDAQEQLNAFLEMDEQGLDLLAIYHSHPKGINLPSQQDLREFQYPGVISLIGCKQETQWAFEGFIIKENKFQKIIVRWID